VGEKKEKAALKAAHPKKIETTTAEKAVLLYLSNRANTLQIALNQAVAEANQYASGLIAARKLKGNYTLDKSGDLVEVENA
jgi:hypothetical protein